MDLCYPAVGPDLPSLPEDGFWFRGIVVFNKSEGDSQELVPRAYVAWFVTFQFPAFRFALLAFCVRVRRL